MEIQLIKSTEPSNYNEEIIKDSFNIHENCSLKESLNNNAFNNSKTLYDIKKDDIHIGICLCSLLEEFLYIEYFAIERKYRCLGYGTAALKKLMEMHDNIIVEVVPEDTNDLAYRRVNWYRSLGFYLYNDTYPYPYFLQNGETAFLDFRLMSSNELTSYEYKKVINLLHKNIYNLY